MGLLRAKTKLIQDKLKIITSTVNNKIIYSIICINIVIISGYFLSREKTTSGFYLISSSDSDGENNEINGNIIGGDHAAAAAHVQTLQFGLKGNSSNNNNRELTFGDTSVDAGGDISVHSDDRDEKARGVLSQDKDDDVIDYSDDLDNPVDNPADNPVSKADGGLPSTFPIQYDGEGGDGTNNSSSFVFSPAFPRQQKPVALTKWVRAHDSHIYFQPIDQSQGWVFSAFYVPAKTDLTSGYLDHSGGKKPTVRAFVMLQRNIRIPVYCHFYTPDKKRIGTSKGKRRSMKDGHGTKFAPCYVQCPAPDDVTIDPYFVSMTFDPDNNTPSNRVKIQYPGRRVRTFTVCFSPLHSNYNFTSQLVEAFEFNQVLGASHFFVYNFSISPQTDAILRGYESQGLVTILQWRLPNLELWYYGQVLAVNDCIYRNKGASEYVVVTDTDELILPHKHNNWIDLIRGVVDTPSMREEVTTFSEIFGSSSLSQLTPNTLGQYGAWSFRCSFYADKRLEPDELKTFRNKFQFSLAQKKFLVNFPSSRILGLKRLDRVFSHGKRSKTIVRPEYVEVGGVHIVPRLTTGSRTAYVQPETALLHHYRDFKAHQHRTLDLSALRFKDTYLERLEKALVKFPTIFPFVSMRP